MQQMEHDSVGRERHPSMVRSTLGPTRVRARAQASAAIAVWRCPVLQPGRHRIPAPLPSDGVVGPAGAALGQAHAPRRLPCLSAPVDNSTMSLQASARTQALPESAFVARLVLSELWLLAVHRPPGQVCRPGSEPEGPLQRGAQLMPVGSGACYADAASAALAEPRRRVQTPRLAPLPAGTSAGPVQAAAPPPLAAGSLPVAPVRLRRAAPRAPGAAAPVARSSYQRTGALRALHRHPEIIGAIPAASTVSYARAPLSALSITTCTVLAC